VLRAALPYPKNDSLVIPSVVNEVLVILSLYVVIPNQCPERSEGAVRDQSKDQGPSDIFEGSVTAIDDEIRIAITVLP